MSPYQEMSSSREGDEWSCTSTNDNSQSMETGNGSKELFGFGGEDPQNQADVHSRSCDDIFNPETSLEKGSLISQHQQQEQQDSFSDYDAFLNELMFDVSSPSSQSCLKQVMVPEELQNKSNATKPSAELQDPPVLTSLQLLNSCSGGLTRLGRQTGKDTLGEKVVSQGLSTEEIMRIAAARFIQSSTESLYISAAVSNPFALSRYGYSLEEVKNIELAELLLSAAEKVGNEQFERASRLLYQCDLLATNAGNPVERVVYYFARALQERIDRQTGRITQVVEKIQSVGIKEALIAPTPNILACYQEVPFPQVPHFSGAQTILERVTEAKKIHVIDLGINTGLQLIVLMQALLSRTDCPLQLLKVTAVWTSSEQLIETAAKRLKDFAESIGMPLSFHMVIVSDILELKEDSFTLDADEVVVVYCEYLLMTLISVPDRLESLMRVIRKLNPRIMVVTEAELNTASPAFVNRFVEALFYFGAYFDSFEACMKRDDPNRLMTESLQLGEGIRNTLAAEGEERRIRFVKISVWRAFFRRYRMFEVELSRSSLCQASLLLRKFACGHSCTLDMDGKALLIGWKGTPLHSLSAWRFI